MKIAIIGARAIPVSYSTFETLTEVLSKELVKRGHNVFVYCRSKYLNEDTDYLGVKRIILPNIETKHLGTFTHSFLSTMHAMILTKYDAILFLGVGNTIFSLFPRFFGTKTAVHIDGLDWKRKKWGGIAKVFLRFSLFLTSLFPNVVVSDNEYMVDYYRKRYHKQIKNIPYGYFSQKHFNSKPILEKYGVNKKQYLVWVGRFVPENNIEELLEAFSMVKSNIKCLIIGDDLFETNYKRMLYMQMGRNKRIIRTGFIPHEDVLALVANALAYIETKRNGGTQMTLVEAMGTGVLIVANDSREHKNILSDNALYYSSSKGYKGLMPVLQQLCMDKDRDYKTLRDNAKKRAMEKFQWEKVVGLYEDLFFNA